MGDDPRSRVTDLVTYLTGEAGRHGSAAEELMAVVYDELRGLARGFMARERHEHTLQPTALVHEAYLRMVDQSRVDWQGRTHFRAVGARMMRRVLVDHARRHRSGKRGGEQQRITFAEANLHSSESELDLDEFLDLHAAIERLRSQDERQADVIELRFFGGLGMDEVAETLGVSKRSVEGDWMHGRAWLKRELAANRKSDRSGR